MANSPALPNFNYAYAFPAGAVVVSQPQVQTTTPAATRPRVTFGNLPTRPRGQEPKVVDNFGNIFSLQKASAGMIAQRRVQGIAEATADETRERFATYMTDAFLATHPEVVAFRSVDFQQSRREAVRETSEEPMSPFSV